MPRLRSPEPQIIRCLSLLFAMVRARRGIMLRRFVESHGWNLRAAYRDVQTLRDVGVPVEQPEYGWYRVEADWIPIGTIGVTRDELLALCIARRFAPGFRETSVGKALDSLWSKLATPGRQAPLPLGDEAAFRFSGMPAIDLGPHQATIDTVLEAIRSNHALRVGYRNARGDVSERVIEPSFVHWCRFAEALYVRAYCRERAAHRLFAIHRILSSTMLDESFERRPDPAWEDGRGFRLWHGASIEHVSIRFSPLVAAEICERRWHDSQHVTEMPDGGVTLEMDIAAPEELERWLLGFGADAEVLAPGSFAERLRRRHAEAAGLRVGTLRAPRTRLARAVEGAALAAGGGGPKRR